MDEFFVCMYVCAFAWLGLGSGWLGFADLILYRYGTPRCGVVRYIHAFLPNYCHSLRTPGALFALFALRIPLTFSILPVQYRRVLPHYPFLHPHSPSSSPSAILHSSARQARPTFSQSKLCPRLNHFVSFFPRR